MRHLMSLLFLGLAAITLSTSALAADYEELSEAERDQLLAPIALYPDSVLSHVLIASTYPLEVVMAARWTAEHPELSGAEAVAAVEDQGWDPSVQALVAFPDLLQRMSEDLDWTERLGEAFLADEEAVLDSVQNLRQQAYDAGSLNDLDYLSVSREADRHIIIEPVRREVIYVPWYDSRVVYGHWRWAHHPPVYWHHHYHHGYHHSRHSYWYWGPRVSLSWHFYFGAFRWDQRHLVVIHDHHRRHWRESPWRARHIAHHRDAARWRYDARHRRGVVIRNARSRAAVESRAPVRLESRSRDAGALSRSLNRQPIRSSDVRQRLERSRPARETRQRETVQSSAARIDNGNRRVESQLRERAERPALQRSSPDRTELRARAIQNRVEARSDSRVQRPTVRSARPEASARMSRSHVRER